MMDNHEAVCTRLSTSFEHLGDAVLLDFWCGFEGMFILRCGIAVLQNQAVCGI